MKRLWIAIGILLAAIVLCIVSLQYQRTAIRQLEQELDTAENAVRAGNMTEGLAATLRFQQHCAKTDARLDVLSRHAENGPLQQSAALLPGLLREEAMTDYFTEVARCRFFLEELRRSEQPLLGNIF